MSHTFSFPFFVLVVMFFTSGGYNYHSKHASRTTSVPSLTSSSKYIRQGTCPMSLFPTYINIQDQTRVDLYVTNFVGTRQDRPWLLNFSWIPWWHLDLSHIKSLSCIYLLWEVFLAQRSTYMFVMSDKMIMALEFRPFFNKFLAHPKLLLPTKCPIFCVVIVLYVIKPFHHVWSKYIIMNKFSREGLFIFWFNKHLPRNMKPRQAQPTYSFIDWINGHE